MAGKRSPTAPIPVAPVVEVPGVKKKIYIMIRTREQIMKVFPIPWMHEVDIKKLHAFITK